MFAFMEFWYARIGNRDQYEDVMREMRQLADTGTDRERTGCGDHPHLVDPRAALREVVLQRGWPVMTATKISLP